MPELKKKKNVEGFRLTKEHKAFFKNYKKVAEVQAMIAKGLKFEMGKLQALKQMAQEVEGKRKELMLNAPEQSVLDVEDEGMVV